jgi:hypothetical protein
VRLLIILLLISSGIFVLYVTIVGAFDPVTRSIVVFGIGSICYALGRFAHARIAAEKARK